MHYRVYKFQANPGHKNSINLIFFYDSENNMEPENNNYNDIRLSLSCLRNHDEELFNVSEE